MRQNAAGFKKSFRPDLPFDVGNMYGNRVDRNFQIIRHEFTRFPFCDQAGNLQFARRQTEMANSRLFHTLKFNSCSPQYQSFEVCGFIMEIPCGVGTINCGGWRRHEPDGICRPPGVRCVVPGISCQNLQLPQFSLI